VFKDVDLLQNIHKAEKCCTISGVSSDPEASITATHVGDFGFYKEIYACPGASANILSFSCIKPHCDVRYNSDLDEFTSTSPDGQTLSFRSKDGLYVHHVEVNGRALVSTVESNKQPETETVNTA
jgi:hypothetical protein